MQTPSSDSSFFLRLFKKTKSRDKVLIAVDAICSIEERADDNSVRIYTMDGFWYDVEDSIESIANVLPCKGVSRQNNEPTHDCKPHVNKAFTNKGKYFRQRKFMPPMAAENKSAHFEESHME